MPSLRRPIRNEDEYLWDEHVLSPGEVITAHLKRRRLSQHDLAVMIGRSEKYVSELMHGKVRLTYEISYDIARAISVPAAYLNKIEALYQSTLTTRRRIARLDTPEMLEWAGRFPYGKMAEKRLVPFTDDPVRRAYEILEYFGVTSAEAYERCCRHPGLTPFKLRKETVDELRGDADTGSDMADARPLQQSGMPAVSRQGI